MLVHESFRLEIIVGLGMGGHSLVDFRGLSVALCFTLLLLVGLGDTSCVRFREVEPLLRLRFNFSGNWPNRPC